jgi:hypothetical protein
MLVSHLHRFIYLKSIKTASTSTEQYFEKYCMPPGEWEPAQEVMRPEYISETGMIGSRGLKYKTSSTWNGHTRASLIKDYLDKTDPAIWGLYFKFVAVRNPFEKAISQYYMEKKWAGQELMSMNDEKSLFNNWFLHGKYSTDAHIYPIGGNPVFDDIIRYEHIHTDIEKVCNKIGVPYLPFPDKEAKDSIRPAEATPKFMFTRESINKITTEFSQELQMFGYSFPE